MTSAVAAVVLVATLTVVWAAPPNPCFRAQMPNNDDPYSFYKCDAGGKAHLWRCAAGTMYDRRTQICDWEDQVRARNGQSGSGTSRPNYGGNRGEGGREGRENGGREGGGRRPNRPGNREPGPLDPDYDNGEDWGEMESWRDQFRESENMSPRDRENDRGRNPPRNDRENGGRNPPRNDQENGGSNNGRAPRLDCSARADGPGAPPRMYPNPDDCATFFTCNMRRPVLTYCPRGLNYNPRRRGCDDSDPPNCRNVRGTQTPAEVFVYNRRLLPDVTPSNDVDVSDSKPLLLPSSEEEVVLLDSR